MKKLICTLLTALVMATAVPVGAAPPPKGVVLNFTDVDIATMVKFISDLTGKNFVLDDRVKGKISVYSPTKLTPDEAFNVFTSVLELKGFTVVPQGKVLKIVPSSQARQSGMKITTGKEKPAGPTNEAFQAQVIPLDSISANDAVTFLQPVVSKDGHISAFGPGNMMLVVDTAANIQKILSLVKVIDNPQKREGGELVFLKNASAENLATVIRDWMGTRAKTAAPGGAPAAAGPGAQIVPDARLNALLLFGSDKDKEDIKRLISIMDVPPPNTSSKVQVYYLENAEATEVSKVLDGIIRGAGTAPAAPGAPGAVPAAASPFEGSKISVMPDKATNSLVIMASPNDYQSLVGVIQKLDRRRRQVFVEALIAEVSLDKLQQLGLQLGVAGGGASQHIAAAGMFDPFNFLGGTPQQQAIVQLLSKFSNVSNISGNLNMLVSNGAVNVLSTPNIMTSDNKEAEIFVGENVPFLGKVDLTTNSLATQSIERKDTGITLRITPQISEGDYIKLDLYQEISAVKDSVGQAKDLVTTKRSAKTSVVVKDNETVAIGGLIQDRDREVVDKIWLLGDIPVLGWLFKTKHTQREKTNLLILLTPKIIRDARDMAEISRKQREGFGMKNLPPGQPEAQPKEQNQQ